MIDVRLNIPTLESDFEAIVDSIRTTGAITNVVVSGGESVVTTENTLKIDDVINIDGLECRVDQASSTEITVNQEVNPAATSWKALFPYFMDGHLAEVAKRLLEIDSSGNVTSKEKKYPLVILQQDIGYDMNKIHPNETSVSFFIVNKTDPDYITEQRRENNFEPILDPLYNQLMGELRSNQYFRITDDNWNAYRRYYWGSSLTGQSVGNDFLDAIEVSNLNLELITQKCT